MGKINIKLIYKKVLTNNWWYWFIVVLVWTAQLFYTIHSTNKIRLEELSESIRNVYWLQQRIIYDGISSNVGWYGTLLIVYNLFGFRLFTAKFFRLGLHFISLLCLAAILKKYFKSKANWINIAVVGLSPTLLYFNTLQTSFGIDLQYFPICLYLVVSLNFSKSRLMTIIKQVFLWMLIMIVTMSYPSFIPYIPVLFIIYLVVLLKTSKKISSFFVIKNLAVSLLAFCLPLIIVFIYLKDPQVLIYDNHVHSGIFRGGGGQIPTSWAMFINNMIMGSKQVWRDLFVFPGSLYFEADIVRAEFSHKFLWLLIFCLFLFSFWVFIHMKKYRLPLLLSWLLLLLSLLAGNISNNLQGIRRSTGVLTSIYAIYICVWNYCYKKLKNKRIFPASIFLIGLLMLPLHHIRVFPNNYAALSLDSPHAADACFNKYPNNPDKSFNYFLEKVKAGEKINNHAQDFGGLVCRLHDIYAATAGSCLWNHFSCPTIYGYDENTGGYILLSPALWEKYYFNH